MSQDLYALKLMKIVENPSGHERVINKNFSIEGYNRRCGDRISIYGIENNDMIDALGFAGDFCHLCMASASLLCSHSVGKNWKQLNSTCDQLSESLPSSINLLSPPWDVFFPWKEKHLRHDCILLPIKTLIRQKGES